MNCWRYDVLSGTGTVLLNIACPKNYPVLADDIYIDKWAHLP